MLIAVVCLTLLALAAFGMLFHQSRAQQEREAQWTLERRELLERIQRPERPIVTQLEDYVVPEFVQDQSNLVGIVQNDPEAYLKAEAERG